MRHSYLTEKNISEIQNNVSTQLLEFSRKCTIKLSEKFQRRVLLIPPQDMSQWYANYFEPKATQTLGIQENLLLPFNYLEEFEVGTWPIVRDYQRR